MCNANRLSAGSRKAHTRARTHTHTRARTHARTRTRAHTHTHVGLARQTGTPQVDRLNAQISLGGIQGDQGCVGVCLPAPSCLSVTERGNWRNRLDPRGEEGTKTTNGGGIGGSHVSHGSTCNESLRCHAQQRWCSKSANRRQSPWRRARPLPVQCNPRRRAPPRMYTHCPRTIGHPLIRP